MVVWSWLLAEITVGISMWSFLDRECASFKHSFSYNLPNSF
jgi:hypothetical protein